MSHPWSYLVNWPRFVVPSLGLFVTVGLLLADDQDSNPTARNSADSTAVELVEVLRGAVTAGEPTSLFELVGRSETIRDFDWGIDSSEVVDFRLQFDRKNESLRWAMKVKKETFPKPENRKQAPEQWTYVGVAVQGGDLTRFSGSGSRPMRVHYETFDEAMVAARVPSPAFFGVVSYSLFQDGEKELKRLETIVMHPKTTIRVEALTKGVRYVARNQESDKRFIVYKWEFRLPDYAPQSLIVDRSITGELKRIRSQRLYWEKSQQGQQRPFRIAVENPVIKRKPEGGHDIGRKHIDVELVWIAPQDINKMEFVNIMDIQKYLEIGEAIAKQRNSIPTKTESESD